ncbi:MAG TPA: carbohydrate porin [Stellaceae bacterium]|nr:carbohydrate porin [Stellaceae bacterium]
MRICDLRLLAGVALLAAGAALFAAAARADDQAPGTAPAPKLNYRTGRVAAHEQPQLPALTPTQAIDAAPVERLFDDWGGVQPWLQSRGINLQFNALTEFAGNVTGGTHRASSFASQIGFSTDINWERLAGITGLSTHTVVVNRSGSNVSHSFGDNLLPVQEIYGSGGNVAFHLVSAYAQETLYDGRFDAALGRMNVENDFASSPLYCGFLNNGLCGDPKALPGGDIGHSAYPDAAWALRVRVRPTPDTYIESGVYEVNQGLYTDKYFRSGWNFGTSQDSGVYIPVEAAWLPRLGPGALPGHYKLGFGYDTSSTYKDFTNTLAAAGVPGYVAQTHTGNLQGWALADQMLVRNGPGDDTGLIALAGFIQNDPNNTQYGRQFFSALLDRGFWNARPQDGTGILFTYVDVSDRLGDVERIQQSLGLPLSNNATGVQSHEMILEVNYDIHVFRGVHFQPDFQYVFRPNAQANIHDAAVFGFRARVEF